MSSALWYAACALALLPASLSFASPDMEPLRSLRLLTVPLALLLGHQHRWAERSQVPFTDLARDRVLMFRRECSPAMHDAILATADRCGITLPVSGYVDDSAKPEERRTTGLLNQIPGLTHKVNDGWLSAEDLALIDHLAVGLSDIFDSLPELRSMAVTTNAFRADFGIPFC